MIGLIQRVTHASVEVDKQIIGSIDKGLLVLVGVEKPDTSDDVKRLAERIAGYRVFSDEHGKMNLSVQDIRGGVLLVPQFTLPADTQKGMRPSFHLAAPPDQGARLFDELVSSMNSTSLSIATGRFGADMQVSLTNDGPVTFWLSTRK